MLEMEFRLAQQSMAISTQYPVMIIGGAEDKVNGCDILKAFFKSAGGDKAAIGIIPAASREPTIVGDRYYQIFTGMGARQVRVLDIRLREECDEARWLDALNECSGIFVTGGDQVRLCELLRGTRLIETIKEKLKDGKLVIAGTSAGAAMMGEKMIAGGSSGESPNPALVDLSEGLGIVPEMLVDQHFHNRNRMARLLSAIAANPDRLGVGIDEDTCIAMVGDGTFDVLGKGTITIVDPGSLTHPNFKSSFSRTAHNGDTTHPATSAVATVENTFRENTFRENTFRENTFRENLLAENSLTDSLPDSHLPDIPLTDCPIVADTAPLSLHNLKVHVLKRGDRYDYEKRTVIAFT